MLQKTINLFFQGHCLDAHRIFGAHFGYDGGNGVRFTLYAPNARSVQVIGDFNQWSGQYMEKIDDRGIWSTFIFNVQEYEKYKYKIETQACQMIEKADPYAFFSELRPSTCSKVFHMERYPWSDEVWMQKRSSNKQEPLNIYEVHLGSWRKKNNGEWYSYEEIAQELVSYVKEMGYTHIELMPLSEHPFDGSWGYQNTSYYSMTSRYGNPKQLMSFINLCHRNDIGVLMDFVPVHFVKDMHGLAKFDGGYVYEYEKEQDRNSQWDTINFDLWKETVRSYLISAASFLFEYYHMDGLRIDAVSNMIFWQGNKELGVNQGACDFTKRMNYNLHKRYAGIMMIAEDSSDFMNVTKDTSGNGLGFDYKWDLGWMNDTLKYYALDPVYRKYDHNVITFSMAYYYSEKFLLPLSHDEVVHGKGTIVNKMWGSYDQKFAQLRNLYTYMFTHPGKKLNFMGNELAQFSEWDEKKGLDWHLLQYSRHAALHRFVRDLNMIYKYHRAFSRFDTCSQRGFFWIDADNTEQSVYTYVREDERELFVIVLNMTPVSYDAFRIGVPRLGNYEELINSEKDIYEGCNQCNYAPIHTDEHPMHRQAQSISIQLAPFAAVILQHKREKKPT